MMQTEVCRSLVPRDSLLLASLVGRAHVQPGGKAKMFAEFQVQNHKAGYKR